MSFPKISKQSRYKATIMRLCSIDGCDKPHMARSFCNAHYKRFKSTGDPRGLKIRTRGSGSISNGYARLEKNGKKTGLHRLIAARVFGRPLPAEAVVHHVDEDPLNNKNSNLVICENPSYHQLLHRRKRALENCGHATWRSCNVCHRYDHPENLYVSPHGSHAYHVACQRTYLAAWWNNRREQNVLPVY